MCIRDSIRDADKLDNFRVKDTEKAEACLLYTSALDLTKEENLSKQEKEALRYLFWSYLTNAQESLPDGGSGHIDVMLSTWEELTEEGLIDKENLDFPEGILITIKAGQIKNDSFRFDVEKWRSGLGAIGYDSCEGTFAVSYTHLHSFFHIMEKGVLG